MMIRACVAAFAASLAAQAMAGLVILGDARSVHAFALADNPVAMQHDEEAADDAAVAPGEWTGSVFADAEAMFAVAVAEAFQISDVSGQGIEFTGDVSASGYSEDPDSSVSGDAANSLVTAFRLDAAQRLLIHAAPGTTDGSTGGAIAHFSLWSNGAPIYEYDALAGLPPLDVNELFPAGDYEVRIELSAMFSVPSLGGGGASASMIASVLVASDCPGDANGDGLVNFIDLNHVLSDFGMTAPGLTGDVDNDGDCDFVDLNIVLSNFGVTC